MNDIQQSQEKMFLELINFFENESEILNNNRILKNHFNKLKQLQAELSKYTLIQFQNYKGYASEKQKTKQILSEKVFSLSSILRSYAVDANDNAIYYQFRLPPSALKKLRDIDIVNYSSQLSKALTDYAKKLKPYKLTNNDITELNNLIAKYSDELLIPTEKRKTRVIATEKIKSLITEILQLIKLSLDNDMVYYKEKLPNLYDRYKIHREIYNHKTVHISLKGEITTAYKPTKPLQWVKVVVKFANNKTFTKTSTSKGNFMFKKLPKGKCSVSFSLPYHNTITQNTVIEKNNLVKLNVQLEKSEEEVDVEY